MADAERHRERERELRALAETATDATMKAYYLILAEYWKAEAEKVEKFGLGQDRD
jgi:hypothetical protein